METSAAVGLANNKQQYSLWVDKYTPVTYADLVSDDVFFFCFLICLTIYPAVNRNTLTWSRMKSNCNLL